MEVVRSLNTHFLFQFPPISVVFTGIGTCHSNSSFKFQLSSPNCCCRTRRRRRRNLKVSAHFVGKATTRPNYLRKKLIPKEPTLLLPSNLESSPSSSPRKEGKSYEPRDNYDDEEATALVVDELNQKPSSPPLGLDVGVGRGELGKTLGSWVDQYHKDVQLWGFGSGTIFTILVDSNGDVKQVEVNEDEIHNRTPPPPPQLDSEALATAASSNSNNKVLLAQRLAREMELGNYSVIPRNSSVAKFIVSGTLQEESESLSSRFVDSIRDLPLIPPKLNIGVGCGVMAVLFGFVLVWAVSNKKRELQEPTELEKEMIRRKMKARKEKEMSVKVQLEVVETPFDKEEEEEEEEDLDFSGRPKLNKHEILDIIRQTKSPGSASVLQHHSSSNQAAVHITPQETEEIWGSETSEPATVIMEGDAGEECLSSGNEQSAFPRKGGKKPINGTTTTTATTTNATHVNHQLVPKVSSAADSKIEASSSSASNLKVSDNTQQRSEQDICKSKIFHETAPSIINTACDEAAPTPVGRKPRKIIRSVEEARKYLSSKRSCKTNLQGLPPLQENDDRVEEGSSSTMKHMGNELVPSDSLSANTGGLTTAQMAETASTGVTAQSPKIDGVSDDGESSSGKTENWIQENFGEVEPVAEKIAAGFRDNYVAAKEKVVNKNSSSSVVAREMSQLQFPEDGSEFEWMKDDRLREIVFQVRENELMGRDPFYSMDAEDKCAFFEGLEKKVVQENEKLLHLHEYLHSNIDNLDYGADGISVYDRPEKFVPRWKGPTMEKDPEFLRSYREAFLDKKAAYAVEKDDDRNIVQESSSAEIKLKNSSVADFEKSKIVIESSDGSVKAGKKSGKEYWQHTKKWSRGFVESYNAETDPEVKSVMKEMGKDLDRWITDKEIEEAADILDKLPVRKKEFIEKKLDKVKREMELFGPQAVVSKYREYAEGDEEDYLWWLDLPHVLCIELYIHEDGEQKIGFYSLEMAPDLELDPKPKHVIAFEDPHDCKGLCYIIQAHMEMLGNGHAFVVPRPPKDAYREAKANGFGVTVIRKGEVKLNIDKTLEEVEEEITEIGSRVYQDKIIKERSADISGLMKGVFGFSGKPPSPTKRRRSRQKKLKKPSKKPK